MFVILFFFYYSATSDALLDSLTVSLSLCLSVSHIHNVSDSWLMSAQSEVLEHNFILSNKHDVIV